MPEQTLGQELIEALQEVIAHLEGTRKLRTVLRGSKKMWKVRKHKFAARSPARRLKSRATRTKSPSGD